MSFIGSEPDQFSLSTSPTSNFINTSVVGKFRRDNRLYPSQGTFIVAGQSNPANSVDAPLYTPTNISQCDQINILDGGVYAAIDPLVGCSGTVGNAGNLFTRMADKLIDADKYERVVLVPCGIGSTSIAQWDATLFDHIIVAYRRAKALGFPINGILWQQGETDNANGMTGTVWANHLRNLRNKLVAEGCNATWMIAKSTYYQGSVSASIQTAIDGIWSEPGFVQGPDTDILTGFTYRNNPDNVHFNVTGADAAASFWKDRIVAYL